MISEKLIVILEGFSKYELNQLRKFLLSPYFNEQAEVVELFNLCNAALRKGPEAMARLDKPAVWRQLYPGQPYNDAHLRRVASDLTQLALKFMALERREGYMPNEWLDLQEVLIKPEQAKHVAGVERQLERYWEQHTEASAKFYFDNFRMRWNRFYRGFKTVATTDFVERILPADHYLECFYLVQKMQIYISWQLYRRTRSTEQGLPVMPGFWEYIREERFAQLPLVIIYRNIILCLDQPEKEENFEALLQDLHRYAAELSEEDLRDCYQIAQNYCAFMINSGKTEYYRKAFGIYRQLQDQNILLESGQIPEGLYKNIITISMAVGELEWAEKFIHEYSEFLPVHIRDNARVFSLAHLYFYQKAFEKVIELLRNVEYKDVVYALGGKLLLLRTYYESSEYLAMDSLADSFRIFLRRNKVISKNLKREYINFLNFIKKLSSLNGSGKPALEAFRKRVSETQQVITKKWLLEKIDELQTR